MTERQPWWYSGDESEPPESTPTLDQQPAGATPVDWTALFTGAQRIVDWATDRVIAPHSEHDDPRDHPDCMVCRTLVVAERFDIGIPRSWPPRFGTPEASAGVDDAAAEREGNPGGTEAGDPDEITWIAIID